MSSVEGFDRIKTKLDRISRELITSAKNAMEESLKSGEQHAKQVVPVKTGNLRDSIQHNTEQSSSEVTGILSADPKRSGALRNYAKPVEYGHRARNGRHVSERPYLRPGRETAWKDLKNNLSKEVRELLA